MKRGKQESTDWSSKTKDIKYFLNQLNKPYQSTVSIFDFIDEYNLIKNNSTIIDACCGSGCNTFYAAEKFTPKRIIGFDYQEDFLSMARDFHVKRFNLNKTINTDINFWNADLFDIKSFKKKLDYQYNNPKINGIIYLQTLSWVNEWEESLSQLASLDSEWILISSLFYSGLIEAEITIKLFSKENKYIPYDICPYNIYSIQIVEEFLKGLGFKKFYWKEFKMKTPLPKPSDQNKMGTYTVEMLNGELLQLSGPLKMPWHFLIALR